MNDACEVICPPLSDSRVRAFSGEPLAISSVNAGLVAMYENELVVTFRTFDDGLLFFSMADQGDLLVVQLHHGVAQVLFDFGTTA